MRFEQRPSEKKSDQLSLRAFSVLKDTQWEESTRWEGSVSEKNLPIYKSTMRLGHAVLEKNIPLTVNISTTERERNGSLQEEERDVYMIIGDLDTLAISLKLSIAHKKADHPNYSLVHSSILKQEKPFLEKTPEPLPPGIGRELYRTALLNLHDLLKDANALPAKHIIQRNLYHGNAKITPEKWYEWFGPIIEEFGYTPDPEEPGAWEKMYFPRTA